MPYRLLTDQQRAVWGKLSAEQAFGQLDQELAKRARLFAAWERSRLEWTTALLPDGEHRVLSLRYPDAGGLQGLAQLEVASIPFGAVPPAVPLPEVQASSEERPPAPALPEAFRRKLRLPAGKVTLASLTDRLEASCECKIRIPSYARDRALVVAADGVAVEEVIRAVEALYGWKLTPDGKRSYFLGRPRFAVARDAAELHDRVRAATPPVALLALADNSERGSLESLRGYLEILAITQDIGRMLGENWEVAEVGKLDPTLQRRLANIVFMSRTRHVLKDFAGKKEPLWWLTQMEAGNFQLFGEVGPGKKPFLRFVVERKVGTRTFGQFWGWSVGSSSLGL